MKLEGRKLIAEKGKLLDFAKPQWALDEDHVPTQMHLYAEFITLGKMDKAENYIEVDASVVEEG